MPALLKDLAAMRRSSALCMRFTIHRRRALRNRRLPGGLTLISRPYARGADPEGRERMAAFKTWATERTNYPREVVELCLSHVQGEALERAYQRGDILDKRRRLM